MLLLLSFHFLSFSFLFYWVVFYWSLSNNKSLQISRTFLCILVDFYSAVVSSWFLRTISRVLFTIDFNVTFMFHKYFTHLSNFLPSFTFFFTLLNFFLPYFTFFAFTFMLGCQNSLDNGFAILARIQLSVCTGISQRILFISLSMIDSGLCIYNLSVSSWLQNSYSSNLISSALRSVPSVSTIMATNETFKLNHWNYLVI